MSETTCPQCGEEMPDEHDPSILCERCVTPVELDLQVVANAVACKFLDDDKRGLIARKARRAVARFVQKAMARHEGAIEALDSPKEEAEFRCALLELAESIGVRIPRQLKAIRYVD